MVMMKRSREEMENNIALDMAKYLILLSSSNGGAGDGEAEENKFIKNETLSIIKGDSNRVFECKTCNRKFQSFQALGGHRASHKKPRMLDSSDDHQKTQLMKPKSHECSICGSEFPIGQALGGHMRRHRAAIVHEISSKSINLSTPSHQEQVAVSILRRSNSSRRVLCLDLNLSPPGSVDYEFSGIPNTGISSSSPRKSTSKPMIHFFI